MSSKPETKTTNQSAGSESSKLHDGLKLALLAPAAYVVVYTYEAGQAATWSIPRHLIEISTTSMLVAFAGLAGLAILFLLAFGLIASLMPKKFTPLRKRIALLTIPAVVGLLGVLIAPPKERLDVFFWLVGTMFFLGYFEFGRPLISQRNAKGFLAKLEAEDAADDKKKERDIPEKHSTTRLWLVLAALAFLVLTFTYRYGRSQAVNQRKYYVMSDPAQPGSQLVLLKRYGSYLVCSEVDLPNAQLKPRLRVLDVNTLGGIPLALTETGELEPAKAEVWQP